MMRTPIIFSADDIKGWTAQGKGKNGLWTQARPMSYSGLNLKRRLSAAWMVFTGRADALVWIELIREIEMLREAAQQALEALEDYPYMSNKDDHDKLEQVINTLHERLPEVPSEGMI